MVHKFSVSFYVRSNYSNRDGMEPVISRINLDGKRLSIGSTGVKVMPGHWNGLTGRVRGDDEQAARSNEELDRIAHSLYSVYYQIGCAEESVKLLSTVIGFFFYSHYIKPVQLLYAS
jgi:hypothetical protein